MEWNFWNKFKIHTLRLNRNRHKRIEERGLTYSSKPEELDARLDLKSHGLEHWNNPMQSSRWYLEFYDQRVIPKEERQGILKHLKGDSSYQREINPKSPE